MGKKQYIIFLIVIIITIIALLTLFEFQTEMSITIFDKSDNKATFFRGRLFNYNIQGIKNDKSLFHSKLVKFTKNKVSNPIIMKNMKDNNIIFQNQDEIEIYSSEGTLLHEIEVGKGKDIGYILSIDSSDLNGDSRDELLIITGKTNGKYGEKMVILEVNSSLNKILDYSFGDMNPWKVQVCDIDGDDRKEIAITMYKKTEFHPIMANRPYIYEWIDRGIFPKWRGSRLSRPFDDYIFLDIDNDKADNIASIELLQDGRKIINLYQWKGFGFESMGESKEYDDIIDIKKAKNNNNLIDIQIKEGKSILWVTLKYNDGELKEIKKQKGISKNLILE
ncbi:hypothetical protein [Sporosalibacterium faouarense]|uniref:hypothetical protein n=1 Tax=Sporosalibacterium faouarense TaxID=516123 RepID=UPI00192C3E58|nr:hypothetical protein [Sporosalibacterium faouarense]